MAEWARWTFLCRIKPPGRRSRDRHGVFRGSGRSEGEVALEAASDLFGGASFGAASFDVGAGVGLVGHAGDHGHVQGTVEPSATAAIEPSARVGTFSSLCSGRSCGGGTDAPSTSSSAPRAWVCQTADVTFVLSVLRVVPSAGVSPLRSIRPARTVSG